VKEINLGSTGTELSLPMLLTQNPTKIEMRRTLTFYRKLLLSRYIDVLLLAYTYVHSLY
jgi:hypothetical protein